MVFSSLEVTTNSVTLMKTKPLTQLRELIASALKSQTNLSKSFQTFFIETMELILTHTGRFNFTQMARCGRSCESRFRQNFKKSFDWLSFNRSFIESTKGHRIAIAIDPCYIAKSGKKTPGVDWFWSGCAAAMKKGLEILGMSIVDADAKDSVFLKAMQFTGLTHCQARNKEALSFAFNASLTSVNLARAFARLQGMKLSVGSTKTLSHNAAMVDRFIAMSGKSPNMRLNNTDFKELLFYGVRAVA